ncbi:hypothetical protein [Micromonospora sp. NPDC049374]|uniref:hypothetical protein n=1 Tax=Micromonospora sp. NPDC049374 TaxID=3154352 RepID=UPI00341CBD68
MSSAATGARQADAVLTVAIHPRLAGAGERDADRRAAPLTLLGGDPGSVLSRSSTTPARNQSTG